jgi:transcriptional adapter 2-alpha
MYIRENERRRGLLKRRDARKMLKIDVNKSGRIFDFLVSSGMMVLNYDPLAKPPPEPTIILGMEADRPSLTEVKINGIL